MATKLPMVKTVPMTTKGPMATKAPTETHGFGSQWGQNISDVLKIMLILTQISLLIFMKVANLYKPSKYKGKRLI